MATRCELQGLDLPFVRLKQGGLPCLFHLYDLSSSKMHYVV